MLAAKAALAIRYDALAEGDAEGSVDFAIEARTALEKRARELELRKAKIGGHRIGFRLTAAYIFGRDFTALSILGMKFLDFESSSPDIPSTMLPRFYWKKWVSSGIFD